LNDKPETIVRTEAVLVEAEEILVSVRSADGTVEMRRLMVLRVEEAGTYIVARRPDEMTVTEGVE